MTTASEGFGRLHGVFLRGRSNISRYSVAAAVTLLALGARLLVERWAPNVSPHLFFAPAVMVAAWYGGLGPGLLVTVAGALLANYFLLSPDSAFSFTGENLVRGTVFLLVGAQISWLSGAMHAAQLRAEADAQAARRSEKLYRTLAANFPDGYVGLFDRELCWTLVAGAGLTAAGLVREQMEGRRISDTLPFETAAALVPLCEDAVNGKAVTREIDHGSLVYFCHALPLQSQDEHTHVGMVILEDVTERARARQALEWAHDSLEQRVRERTAELHFQKTLLESQSQASADGILAFGNEGRVIFANDHLADMWGITVERGTGQLDDIRREMRSQLQSHQRDPLSADKDEFAVNEPEGSDELILKNGRIIERYSSPIVDPEGTSFGRVWFFRDVTERKRMQRQVLEAAESERQRIGQDLHDDLCQQLTGIACLGQSLHRLLAERDPVASKATQEIVDHVQRANQRARDLARGLQPVHLQRYGLVMSLQELCNSIHTMFKVNCRFRAEHVQGDIDEVVGVQLYRIAQEASSNAIRHGKAGQILIDLVGVGSRLILTIEDDGTGIPQPLPDNGMGLQTMNYRAKLVGGSLAIERSQPSGTIVTCTAPMRAPVAIQVRTAAEGV